MDRDWWQLCNFRPGARSYCGAGWESTPLSEAEAKLLPPPVWAAWEIVAMAVAFGARTRRVPKSISVRRLRLVDRSAHWSVYAQVKKVTIQAHGHYAKLGGRADLLVAMVKDRFREVGEAIGVELKSAEE